MKEGYLKNLDHMPLVIEPETAKEKPLEELINWCAENREHIDAELHRCGALLFRGFDVTGTGDFNRFASSQGGDLQNYVGGDSPRSELADKVYTSTEFPPADELYLHNELSYAGWFPSRVFFHCATAAQSGGETQIGDSRRILEEMPADIAEKFTTKGVAYIQNLHGGEGEGKSWQQTFETEDRSSVEAYCREHDMDFRWTGKGLWTRKVRSGTIEHPLTRERSWFNQADQFHALAPGVARIDPELIASLPAEDWPCHATYGDGTDISLEELDHIRRVFREQEVLFTWRKGDVLMLDNIIAAHGRKPYTGERRILVAMS